MAASLAQTLLSAPMPARARLLASLFRVFSNSSRCAHTKDELPHSIGDLNKNVETKAAFPHSVEDIKPKPSYLYQQRSDFAHPKGLRFTSSTRDVSNNVKTLLNPGELNVELEQVPVPSYEFDAPVFKGLDSKFPCVTKNQETGPEPSYDSTNTGYEVFHYQQQFLLKHQHGILPELKVAYETWGTLNEEKNNAILLCTGLSASSHAKSHSKNENPGWWEKFIGPGCALDTDKFFVICCNNLGGCYGTSGPSTINPLTNEAYGTTFPVIAVEDMVRAQFLLLDSLGINKLYAAVGSSLGAMQSISAAILFPQRVNKTISISGATETHPSGIALRYLQRKAIMMDPNWQGGHYYKSSTFPKGGMKLAREIATITYRSGPEWDERFGRIPLDSSQEPTLCPYFMIESYIDYQGEAFCMKYDPNSLLYISKAMDLFDLAETYGSTHSALARIPGPVMIMGVKTDMLFPVWQQREMAQKLQEAGNETVTYYELNSIYGHDTFLLDINGVGTGVKGFLETHNAAKGRAGKKQRPCGEKLR